jgi:hypothetical protein
MSVVPPPPWKRRPPDEETIDWYERGSPGPFGTTDVVVALLVLFILYLIFFH